MSSRWMIAISTGLVALALSGCAPGGEETGAEAAGEEAELRSLSDNALQGKLRGILEGVTFTSEGDYPYVVLEGEAVTERRLSTKIVREKLRNIVKEKSDDHRDILPAACRARRLNVSSVIADGDAAVVPQDPNDDDFMYARHDKQVGIALKTMRANLKSVVGFTFGTNESGDQDEFGTVLYVYVGISKSSGKLIAIMTEAVYT